MEYLKALGLAIIAVLAPVKTVMISAGVLIAIDLVLGIAAAVKRGEKITSSGLRRTLSKILAYQLAIISGFIVEHYLIEDIIPIVKLIGGVIGVVEIKSILENADTLNGEPIFKSLITRIGSENDKGPN